MKNIYLTGMMGSGKTTIGDLLAKRLGMRFLDLDEAVVHEAGQTIPEIFAEHGEAHFRELESNMLYDLHKLDDLVIATGGGTVLSERNRHLMDHSGTIIYLERDPEAIISTIDAEKRPLLKANPENVRRIYADRRPVYEAAAHLRIVNDTSPEAAVDKICSAFDQSVG